MLHGVHRPGVDVEVRVDLDRGDAETERLEQQARAARDDPLADAGDDTARHQNVPHHFRLAMYQTRRRRGPGISTTAGDEPVEPVEPVGAQRV